MAIQYINNPTEDMMLKAINAGWTNLSYIKNPTENAIKAAINQSGWAIKYVENPSEEIQLLSVRKNYDSIQYIKSPYESVQIEAVNINSDALRYINSPFYSAQLIAIKNDDSAIRFIDDLDKKKLIEFLKINILVIKYCTFDITLDEIEEALKEVISKDDVEEKYIRDFLNCSVIDINSDNIRMDKIKFIYNYGSKNAKKIAVDEILRIMKE